VAALACAWLLNASNARGEERLLPPDPSAPPVRILLILPAESGKLARQVALLDRSLATSRGFLRRARTLDEADVVVEFASYRRRLNDQGVSQDWWEGQFRLLTPRPRDTRLSAKDPSRFTLLVAGRESWEIDPVVDLLARTMARMLGRESRPQKADTI